MSTLNFPTGVSDCHNLVATVINNTLPKIEKQKVEYRSFRNFDPVSFNNDLTNLHFADPFTSPDFNVDINTLYNEFEFKISEITDKHIPTKQMYRRPHQLPYMNRELRKAIYSKKMTYNKYQKYKTPRNWEKYRKCRNLVNKLKKQSMNIYFQERCVGGSKSRDFWTTIKPYLSKKSLTEKPKIALNESNKIVSDEPEVSEIFNNFFSTVADSIGKDYIFDSNNHPSLDKIKERNFEPNSFNFEHTNQSTVAKKKLLTSLTARKQLDVIKFLLKY